MGRCAFAEPAGIAGALARGWGQMLADCRYSLFQQDRRFELGCVLDCSARDIYALAEEGDRRHHFVGRWECDLSNDALIWCDGVYVMFGFPRNSRPARDSAVALYGERSRSVMERLRAASIRHQHGFVLDAQIRPIYGGRRWMRLIGTPIVEDGRAVRLFGLKQVF